jgi:hypothetical protein
VACRTGVAACENTDQSVILFKRAAVHLIPDIGHCGVLGGPSKMPEVMDMVVARLPAQISLASR